MPYTTRPIDRDIDLAGVLALSRAPGNHNQHTADLPYRLASWALDFPHNTRLWCDDAGLPAAWAILQTPFWTFDYAIRPALEDSPLHDEVLAWMAAAARACAGQPEGHPCWFADVAPDLQPARARALAAAGFVDVSHAERDPWSKVLLERPADLPGERSCPPPPGFTIRPLDGWGEAGAYVDLHRAAFGTENMTVPWRERTLRSAAYRPDLDLVAVAPDGRLAAFCIGWFDPSAAGGLPVAQVEPLGVHPDFQGLGLGQAILGEMIRRMRAAGAARLRVETDNDRGPALALYASAGFQVVRDISVCRLDIYAE